MFKIIPFIDKLRESSREEYVMYEIDKIRQTQRALPFLSLKEAYKMYRRIKRFLNRYESNKSS